MPCIMDFKVGLSDSVADGLDLLLKGVALATGLGKACKGLTAILEN